jgi:glutamine synthetase adenylyltransferase
VGVAGVSELRAVGGDLELGKMIETHARHRIHQNAAKTDPQELSNATKHVRDRLEREKGSRGRRQGTDIKYGPGGMLDVYFAARYLQLRDEIPDEGEDRSTTFTLERLRQEGALSEEDFSVLSSGYGLLRAVDHNLRLIVGRSTAFTGPRFTRPRGCRNQARVPSQPRVCAKCSPIRCTPIREAYNRILT